MRPPLGWEGQNIVDPRFPFGRLRVLSEVEGRRGDNQPVSRRAVLHRRPARPRLRGGRPQLFVMPAPLSFPRKREPRG